jgi:hypothetical protein
MRRVGGFSVTGVLLKKSAKPDKDIPEYKQAYLPYEVAPTKAELDNARRRFLQAPFGKGDLRRMVDVKDVPQNMYTYGKEGMSVPIAIFKDQVDPIIGPEWTYPGIYENKISCQHDFTHELFEMERTNSFKSPWQRTKLDNHVRAAVNKVKSRMRIATIRHPDVFHRERGGGTKLVTGTTPAASAKK